MAFWNQALHRLVYLSPGTAQILFRCISIQNVRVVYIYVIKLSQNSIKMYSMQAEDRPNECSFKYY
jgi:hypothetical protein